MKIQTAAILLSAMLVSCCSSTSVDLAAINLGGPNGYVEFIPQDPQPSPLITYYDNTGAKVTKAWTQLSNVQILNILSGTHAQISVGKFDASGNLTYLVAKGTGATGTYRVIMDYCDYVTETVTDEAGQKIGQGRVGVGLRLTADITTSSANIDLGSLLALGVAASANQARGTMTVDSIGIRIAGNAGPILSNSTIDETGIQKTLEAIAVIQSKIADSTTTLDPQVLAVKPEKPTVQPADVSKKLQ